MPENQRIFIRGHHVVRVLNIWPRLRAMAEPAPDPHESGPESEMRLELVGVPADADVGHLCHRLQPLFYGFKVSGSPSHFDGVHC